MGSTNKQGKQLELLDDIRFRKATLGVTTEDKKREKGVHVDFLPVPP
jgi:hypothetical protein